LSYIHRSGRRIYLERALASTLVLWAMGWGREARAQGTTEPTPPVDCTGLSEDDCKLLQSAEAVEIYDERPDKPFDRDTEVRLTGEQLAARGATDLATALALLPDVTVRDAGRGGFNIDVRGGRKGDVSVLIDGVLVTDPYYGTFDLSSIPITDIVEVRIATTPQSPIDGPGGPGGVIEVHTRDAIGPQLVIARFTGDSLPSTGMAFMARAALDEHTAIRLSASGLAGARDLKLAAPFDSIGEDRRDASGAARLEYRDADRRVALDAFMDDRHYVVPPNEMASSFLLVDRETSSRVSIKADDKIGKTQVQGEAWLHYLLRRSRSFQDPSQANELSFESLSALRTGAQALATRIITKEWRWAASATADNEHAEERTLLPAPITGSTTLLEGAADLQFEHGTVRLDGAGGVAVPIGIGADPWPEAKLVGKWRPRYGPLELTATLGRKGRVPTLRERFDGNGNDALAPEQAEHAELRAVEHTDRVHLELAPFYKRVSGLVRLSPTTDMNDPTYGKLINLGLAHFYGADAQARVKPIAKLELGGGYSYIHVDQSIDRLPHHRWDAWAQVAPNAQLSLLARVTYFGDAVNQGATLPGYASLSFTASWRWREYLAVVRADDVTRDLGPQTRPGVYGPGRVVSIVVQGAFE